MAIMPEKKGNLSKYDIIHIILKICVSKMCIIVLLPNLKHTYKHIDNIKKTN